MTVILDLVPNPKIVHQPSFKIIGHKAALSLTNFDVASLWKTFVPLSKHIAYRTSNCFISLSLYPESYFNNFDPKAIFEKWAAVEVLQFSDQCLAGLTSLVIPEGLYAVFQHEGNSNNMQIFDYIYTQWLPKSEFHLANRPHFERLSAGYMPNQANAQEEIWIPVQAKDDKQA